MNDIFDIIKLYQEDLDSYIIKNDRVIDAKHDGKQIDMIEAYGRGQRGRAGGVRNMRNQFYVQWDSFTRNLQQHLDSAGIVLHKVTQEEGLIIFHAGNYSTGKEIKNITIRINNENIMESIIIPNAHEGRFLKIYEETYGNVYTVLRAYLVLFLEPTGQMGS